MKSMQNERCNLNLSLDIVQKRSKRVYTCKWDETWNLEWKAQFSNGILQKEARQFLLVFAFVFTWIAFVFAYFCSLGFASREKWNATFCLQVKKRKLKGNFFAFKAKGFGIFFACSKTKFFVLDTQFKEVSYVKKKKNCRNKKVSL